LVRLYDALSAEQKKTLFAVGGGLDSDALMPPQYEALRQILSHANTAFFGEEHPSFRLTASRKQVDKQFEYTFVLSADGLSKPLEQKFTTPKYIPPKTQIEAKPAVK